MFFTTGFLFSESADNQTDSRSPIYRMEDCCTKDLNKVSFALLWGMCKLPSRLVIEDKFFSSL